VPQIVDRFHQALHDKLSEELAKRMAGLASGDAAVVTGETVTTGEKYAAKTAYIKALHDVIDACEEISAEQHGTQRREAE
jgi:hypothetical protein